MHRAGARQPKGREIRALSLLRAGMRFASLPRVLSWIAVTWLGGLFIGAHWELDTRSLLTGAGLIGALGLAAYGRGLRARLWRVVLALLALCCGLGVSWTARLPCSVSGEARITARVESVRHGWDEARLQMRVLHGRRSAPSQRVPPGLWVSANVNGASAPAVGSTVALSAELRPRTELHNPSPHPALRPRWGAGCWAKLRGLRLVETSRFTAGIDAARARVRKRMNEALPQKVAGVARALVLGDGGALPYARRQTIAAVGLAHLFAVSGLHVALVSGTLVRLLHWLARGWTVGFDPRRLAAALGVPLTLLHASFAGGSPSAWRAAITAAITWSLVAIGRRPSATAVTAGAALVLSAPDPSIALRPAFLLSIVATSAILSAPRVTAGLRWPRLVASATISARTLVATTPMVWWWFGGVPLVGWVTNIVILPFGSWVVVPLAHAFALTLWMPSATPVLATALSIAVDVLLSLCDAFAPLSTTTRLPPLDVAQGLVVLVGCLLLLVTKSWRRRVVVVALAAILWLVAERALVAREQPHDALRVSFVDVGQGDAALIDFPDGRLALVDTGRGDRHPAVRELRGLLAARRRSRIDVLIVTHGHPDHSGGLAQLLEEVEIGELWLNGQLLVEERDGAWARLVSAALARGARARFAPELCESPHHFGQARVDVLWPCPRYDPALGLNDNSITLRVALGRRSFLFTGDVEAEAERRLLEHGRIQPTDVLKVAHHGSRTSTTAAFVEAARPCVAVISSGSSNRYGHPSKIVLERLRAAGARVLRTDIDGGAIISTDGERLEIQR